MTVTQTILSACPRIGEARNIRLQAGLPASLVFLESKTIYRRIVIKESHFT